MRSLISKAMLDMVLPNRTARTCSNSLVLAQAWNSKILCAFFLGQQPVALLSGWLRLDPYRPRFKTICQERE